MALWEVNINGKVTIEYSNGGYSQSPPISGTWAKRYTYTVPYSNVGKGGLLKMDGKLFHTPSWTEVHPQTTLDDIIVEKKPFEELFVEPKTWEFKSSNGKDTYTVKYNRNGNLSCSCWGYIAHKNCKHIKSVKAEL